MFYIHFVDIYCRIKCHQMKYEHLFIVILGNILRIIYRDFVLQQLVNSECK